MKTIYGTFEWADANMNCAIGCSHDCRYCYARNYAVDRFKRVSAENWPKMQIRHEEVRRKMRKPAGTVMFPTSHDICPEVLGPCIRVIHNLLSVGNRVLIVSKPHYECVKSICDTFPDHKKNILFRFTIGASDNNLLRYWEPGAPVFEERLACLELAKARGYQTSVSIEPMLDSDGVVDLFHQVEPQATHTIWIGKMRSAAQRVRIENDQDQKAVDKIKAGQTNSRIKAIYNTLKNEIKVRWNASIKKVIGLALPTQTGTDT